MSPDEIKQMRLGHLKVTQENLAEAIGVTRLVLSHYETGFRRPGATVRIIFRTLESLSQKKSHDLLELFRKHSLDGVDLSSKRSK